jgi:2-C-methyl-D-erythritol 4-phosphate cytidylyltransferase
MTSAIIVAAGSGKRMGSTLPKQFIEINGRSILEHTLLALSNSALFDEIVIVLSEEYLSKGEALRTIYKNVKICRGGKERFHSVKNAISVLNADSKIVFIHDAVRPFVTNTLLRSCLALAREKGSAIPAVPLKDSIRKIVPSDSNCDSSKTVAKDRSAYLAIQTPQVFSTSKLLQAYQTEFKNTFTDDASVFEILGEDIFIAEGDYANLKITSPDDLELAKMRLKS